MNKFKVGDWVYFNHNELNDRHAGEIKSINEDGTYDILRHIYTFDNFRDFIEDYNTEIKTVLEEDIEVPKDIPKWINFKFNNYIKISDEYIEKMKEIHNEILKVDNEYGRKCDIIALDYTADLAKRYIADLNLDTSFDSVPFYETLLKLNIKMKSIIEDILSEYACSLNDIKLKVKMIEEHSNIHDYVYYQRYYINNQNKNWIKKEIIKNNIQSSIFGMMPTTLYVWWSIFEKEIPSEMAYLNFLYTEDEKIEYYQLTNWIDIISDEHRYSVHCEFNIKRDTKVRGETEVEIFDNLIKLKKDNVNVYLSIDSPESNKPHYYVNVGLGFNPLLDIPDNDRWWQYE